MRPAYVISAAVVALGVGLSGAVSAYQHKASNVPAAKLEDGSASGISVKPSDISIEPGIVLETDLPSGKLNEDNAFVPGTLSLDDCIKLAIDRNQRLQAAGYDIEAAEAQLKEAKANFWPIVEYKYRLAPVPTNVDNAFNSFFEGELTLFNSIHLGVGVPLTSFGQLKQARGMARGGVEAARIKTVSSKYDTIYDVKKIYYGIQLANETEKLLSEAIDKLTTKIDDEEMKEDKTMDPYDILRMKVFREELQQRLTETRLNKEFALDGMRLMLDLGPDTPVVIDSYNLQPLLHVLDEEKDYIEAALDGQPNSRLLDIGIDVKSKQVKLEKLKLAPKAGVGFFMDFGRTTGDITGLRLTDDFNNPFNFTRAGVGLQVEGNLDFHGQSARIKKARAEYMKASFERHIAKQGISVEMQKAYETAKRMREEVLRAKKSESMAQQMTFFSKMNIDMGIGDEEKYADALKLLLLMRGQYFKTVYDYNMSLAELERKIGSEKYANMVQGKKGFDLESTTRDSIDMQFYDDDHTDMKGIQNDTMQW